MRKKKGPWTIVGSRVVYKNPWITVVEDKVIRPDGKDGIFGTVNMKEGVSVLPLDDKNNVYLTREYKYAISRVILEAVSGGFDNDEDKLKTAKRELSEEIGVVAGKWKYLGFVDPFTNAILSPNHLYLAQNLIFQKSHPEGTEKIEIVKMPFDKAYQKVMDSEITHSATVALILKTKELLNI